MNFKDFKISLTIERFESYNKLYEKFNKLVIRVKGRILGLKHFCHRAKLSQIEKNKPRLFGDFTISL